MQSAANAQATQAQTQANLVGATQGGKSRRRRGGKNISAISPLYSNNNVPGPVQQQVGQQEIGNQMTVQAQGDQVPLVPAPAPSTGGKKMRK
jgi:hypothetical protein